MRRRDVLPALALLATGACASPVADVAPAEPQPATTTSEPRTVTREEAASKDGVALEVGHAVRIDVSHEIDAYVEIRLLDVVADRNTKVRPGATLELRLVRADGSDVSCTGVRQAKYESTTTLDGRGWTGYVPEGDEPSIDFALKPSDERVPDGWGLRVTVTPVDSRHARLTLAGAAIIRDK